MKKVIDVATQTEEHGGAAAATEQAESMRISRSERWKLYEEMCTELEEKLGGEIITPLKAFEDFYKKLDHGEIRQARKLSNDQVLDLVAKIHDAAKQAVDAEFESGDDPLIINKIPKLDVLIGYLKFRLESMHDHELVIPLYDLCGRTEGCTGLSTEESFVFFQLYGAAHDIFAGVENLL